MTDWIHLYLAFLHHKDYFSRPVSSLSSSFLPQGLFRPDQMHLYLPLFHHKDYFGRLNASQSCSFAPQGLFQPAGCIPIFLFFTAGIISPRSDTSLLAETISTRPFHQLPILTILHISIPLSQIMTSNPRLPPDTPFAVDMFPHKITGPFQESGFKSKPPKKPGIYVF